MRSCMSLLTHPRHPTIQLSGSTSLLRILSPILSTAFPQSSPSLRPLLLRLLTGLLASRPALPIHPPCHCQRPSSEMKICPHPIPPLPTLLSESLSTQEKSLSPQLDIPGCGWRACVYLLRLTQHLRPARRPHVSLHASKPWLIHHPAPGMTSPIPPPWPLHPSR